MNEFKGTPGPWEIKPEEVDRPYIRIRGTVLGGRFKIANVLTPVYEGVDPREAIETRANARLIAASPEMLDLLMKLDKIGGLGLSTHREIQSVITKALGEVK